MSRGLTPAQLSWKGLGYGLFLHFGPNTLQGVGWGDGTFPARSFAPGGPDCAQWASVAREAGMRYAVLTAKHHDGFCLWPSRHTEYCTRGSPAPDIVGAFVEAFRSAGLEVGLYYSLWDRNCPFYEDDTAYAAYMRDQITELLTGYGEMVELWFDGAWDKDHPTRTWMYDPAWESDPASSLGHGERWEWVELYRTIHRLQPDCLVLNNSSSDRPGRVRYPPVDARTAEHFHFVYRGRVCEPPPPDGDLPLECVTTLTPDWFWSSEAFYAHPSAAAIADWRRVARSWDANLLMNIGPEADGRIPIHHLPFLAEAARLLDSR